MVKAIVKRFRYGEKGFTLIELLVVVAILGALAAVVVPNVGKFIGQGEKEAQETELHNIQTAVMAIMVDADSGELDGDHTAESNMYNVTATQGATTLRLSSYMTGLDIVDATHHNVKSGCTYDIDHEGNVTQNCP